ncbi:Uncharacterised protein [Capnocytophaga ochracea]|uniref:Uncharacterized protein n=1 Tax=Capnocytophaga ochracea TaxID=1018 RepID=A0A2X2SVY4_CAPOC|nr:Uncharacterised protein [Capnocytophaga ochracea]SQA94452.1 Uncharacterised protein [Capnocytophaga ochracea]
MINVIIIHTIKAISPTPHPLGEAEACEDE